MGQFMYVVRKRMKLNPEKAVFLYTNLGRIAQTTRCVMRGFLWVTQVIDLNNLLSYV